MITVLTMVFKKYLDTPFEDFTAKYLLARGIFELLDKYDKTDLEKLSLIEKYTHPKVKVSLFKLDRVVNPTKGEYNETDHKFQFVRDVKNTEKRMITMNENEIQNYLCMAIRNVHNIIMRNMKTYKIEVDIGDQGDDDDDNMINMFENEESAQTQ